MFFGIVGIFATVVLVLPPTESSLPPTNAFSKVYVNGLLIEADKYDDELYITTQGSLNTTISGDSVTIKIDEISCRILQGLKSVDASGNLVCAVI